VRLLQTPAAIGQIFNVGSDEEVTIRQLAELVCCAAGSDSELVKVPYDMAYDEGFEDLPRRVPDLRKLEHVIGFRPTTPLREIVDSVIADQQQSRSLELDARPPVATLGGV
jgi:UDP-glucose 4-epimerase